MKGAVDEVGFCSAGFTVVENAVDETACNNALRVILRQVERVGVEKKGFTTEAEVVNLFNLSTRVKEAAACLLGMDASSLPFQIAAQVALRFPGTLCDESFVPLPVWKSFWHIDGLPSADNGIERGKIKNFTLLVGVCLRDVTSDLSGNLVVFPRSHWWTQNYFRKRGFDEAMEGLTSLPPLPGDPHQIKLKKGDVVFVHYSVAHSIAPNVGCDIRTMVYFRLNMRSDGFHPEPMLDIWLDYSPRLKELGRELSTENTLDNNNNSQMVRPGYIDQVVKDHRVLVDRDAQVLQLATKAEELFAKGRFAECAQAFCELSDARADDIMLGLKAGLCQTAGHKSNLPDGEARLRKMLLRAPTYANLTVVLARNLARQMSECGRADLRNEVLLLAERGL